MRHTTKKEMLEQFPRLKKERDRLDLMLYDVLNGAVIWGDWQAEADRSGKYRVGISRTQSYPLAISIWREAGKTGRDHFEVHDLEPWKDELRQLRNNSEVWEPVIQALLSAEAAVRAISVQEVA